jgi:hypothetical protein
MITLTGKRPIKFDKNLADEVNKEYADEVAEPAKIAPDLEGFVYVPSVNLHFSRELVQKGTNWFECHEALEKEGYRMPTILEFIELLKYARANDKSLYDKITEIPESGITSRAEWLDAYFEKRKDGLYVLTENKSKAQKLEASLMKDKEPGIYINDWLDNSNSQGLPKPNIKNGSLCYSHPKDKSVARFDVYTYGAFFDCNRNPSNRNYNIGVRRVREAHEKLGQNNTLERRIILPKTVFGENTQEAYDRVMAREDKK